MFGLTFEKLLVIALIAAVIVGPTRLPHYAQRVAELIRSVRSFLDAARERTEAETGISLEEWKAMDPRRYDPRRIVRDALDPAAEESRADEVPSAEAVRETVVGPARAGGDEHPDPAGVVLGSEMQQVRVIRPVAADETVAEPPEGREPARRRKWVVVGGSSGHPKRVLVDIDDEPTVGDTETGAAPQGTDSRATPEAVAAPAESEKITASADAA
ncbi:hypothetical protein GCM10017576_10780 [Microbacterium barkeri]|uniref:Sec-independent protein translocase protein TatB n=1 Tax=Microbacterium barkeri TaxID=33917 RepID=A0A9W6H2S8_9MICO|nr:hypothetical protein [Microbacterium barkeri]MDR6877793.1 sec-independent protein translocase protein TatB [Microbacterium barkeri]GLJ60949.1 hypothetical protein GCM10017576_10780 [Microbacterium barkeri]